MCPIKSIFFIFLLIFLSSGFCQNAEHKGSFRSSGNSENEDEKLQEHSYDSGRWEESREVERNVDERVDFPSTSSTFSDFDKETKAEAGSIRVNSSNDSTETVTNRGSETTRKSTFTSASLRCNSARGSKRRSCINEMRMIKRRRYGSGNGRLTSSDSALSSSNRIRGSSSRGRRIQERGQARGRNRGRKRNGKRMRQQDNEGRIRSRKYKSSGTNAGVEVPAIMRQATNRKSKMSNETIILKESTLNVTVVPEVSLTESKYDLKSKELNGKKPTNAENIIQPSNTERPEIIHRKSEENVEHEFSKNLEKEILWSRTERPYKQEVSSGNIQDKIDSTWSHDVPEISKFHSKLTSDGGAMKNARFDAAKMLGYSRSPEDLPIMDLENEVLARTLEDYNAYLKSGGKPAKLARYPNVWTEKMKNSQDHPKDDPIPSYHQDPEVSDDEEQQPTLKSDHEADSKSTKVLKGDLTCINGSFLPAPLARHALIKYVKSSIPGHEYLEADYECTPGFYMASKSSRLLCKERRWIGELPNCKIRRGQSSPCSESSCDQVCNKVDGQAKCGCYKGFRLDGHKCIDINECENGDDGCEYKCINTPGSYRCECPKGMKQGEDRFSCMDVNECLLNNGHGPCQDTCRNLEGSYVCSCEGLPGTVLSTDNHTCQDSGPCAFNNSGCSHTCLSTMGRVFCLCPPGFMLAEDWKTCQDVDECYVSELQTEICKFGCINTPGSYRCIDPTELRDQSIGDPLPITCFPGYELTSMSTCVDINECAINNGGCSEACENTAGSYFCACIGDEKSLSSDGKSCTDINNLACPPLDPSRRGYLICTRDTTPGFWRGEGGEGIGSVGSVGGGRRAANRPGTKCYLKCPPGYQLHGEYELICHKDGTWDGPKHGECVKYSKPRLECPKDVLAEIPPNRDEAFVTFDQPSTDLDWFRYVRSKPSWGTRLEASLKSGLHLITFFARHPVSKKQASCVLRIIVKEGEAPKVKNCPNDIVGKNGTSFTWIEPTFTDNVKVTRINNNESPGKVFGIGEWKIVYEASDEAGWTTRCVFSVVVHQD